MKDKIFKVEIICDSDNENDESLNKNRLEHKDDSYDATFGFSVFITSMYYNFGTIRCFFNLYGLDITYTFDKLQMNNEDFRKDMFKVQNVICEWFKDKNVDDICEKMYKDLETDLSNKIENMLNNTVEEVVLL